LGDGPSGSEPSGRLGILITRAEDQIGGGAAPGGGNYWTLDRVSAQIEHRWHPIDIVD
jgi:hypothetical protein